MSIQLKITAETDIGTREENQDRIVINNFIFHNKYYYEEKVISGQEIFLIFDGMGGEQYGSIVAQIASAEFIRIRKSLSIILTKEKIISLLETINNKIISFLNKNYVEGGTTISLAIINETGYVEIYNIGDSPIIYMDKKTASLISEDQSLAGMKLRYGMITDVEYAVSNEKNILMAYLGDRTNKSLQKIYYNSFQCKPDSRIILCSDGITDVLSIQEIHKILYDEQKDIVELINRVKKEPECDNMSIIDIVVQEAD